MGRLSELKNKKPVEIDDSEVCKMNHIVMYSGGLSSWATGKMVIDKYGKYEDHNIVFLFSDVLYEDEDLYRFLNEGYEKLSSQPGLKANITLKVVTEGRSPWQVFFDERFVGNSRLDPCSRILKREILDSWIFDMYKPWECIIYVGLDITEVDRYVKTGDKYERSLKFRKLPYYYEAPLMWKPYTTKEKVLDWLQAFNIEIPRLYSLGFKHNNCGGACIKAGKAQWAQLLKVFPSRYKYAETMEQRFIKEINSTNTSGEGHKVILRDQSGGQKSYITLKDFREGLESNHQLSMFDSFDWGGCGCAL